MVKKQAFGFSQSNFTIDEYNPGCTSKSGVMDIFQDGIG
jgi:hypothetical protein